MLRRWWGAWNKLARSLGDFQSRLLLGVFYFFIVTPFAVAMRALTDPLRLRRAARSSNWMPREVGVPPW